MSSIRLLLLGVLLRRQPIHGYEVRRELEQLHADHWANIAYGSIYSALGKMAEEGLIEAINTDGSERQGAQGARTEYIITESGKAEFEQLLQEYWWELKPSIDPFQIALTFMDQMPRSDLLRALCHRADQLRGSIMTLHQVQATKDRQEAVVARPRHLIEGMRLMIAHMETELRWIEELLCKVERGDLP